MRPPIGGIDRPTHRLETFDVIRKIYLDIFRRRLAALDLAWIFSAAGRYPLVLLSSLVRRPLCGPILGTLVTNYSCNCRCAMCDLPAQEKTLRGKGFKILDTKGMKSIIDGFQKLGVMGVGFTGGEPLLHPDILELLAHCRSRGMLTHLNTNGLLLDDTVARELVRIGVDSVNVSVDGANASTHDAIRGVTGAFDRATGAIRRVLTARGPGMLPRVKTVMVVQKGNVGEIQGLAQLGADLGVDCVEYIPEQPFGNAITEIPDENLAVRARAALGSLLRSSPVPLENSPRMTRLVPWTLAGRRSPLHCLAGYNTITVDCYGRVFPCLPWLNWDRSPSHAQGIDLMSLWRSRGYGKKRDEANLCHDCTLNCQAELNLLFNPFRRITEN